jgi:hypothetical protein
MSCKAFKLDQFEIEDGTTSAKKASRSKEAQVFMLLRFQENS